MDNNMNNLADDRNRRLYLLGIVLGVLIFAAGAVLMKIDIISLGKVIPGVLIGAGAGIFGACGGAYVRLDILRKHPEEALQMKIEEKDERNIMLRDKAKSKAYSIMQYQFGILMLVYSLLNVSVTAILILIGVFLAGEGIMLYYLAKYSKEM